MVLFLWYSSVDFRVLAELQNILLTVRTLYLWTHLLSDRMLENLTLNNFPTFAPVLDVNGLCCVGKMDKHYSFVTLIRCHAFIT